MPAATPHDRLRPWLLFLPFFLFVLGGTAFFWRAQGDDLASSYVGCRVLSTGNGPSLYSHDPVNFAGIDDADKVWPKLAVQGGYHGWLHPYVQTPLWAWLLRPICDHLQWSGFEHLFLVLSLCSVAGCVFLTARFWTPRLLTPHACAIALLALFLSEPFLFAMQLVQTHALLLLLTVAGMVLAERDHPIAAGFLVACAAAIKITPAVLVLYWLVTRRWRAAVSLLGWSVMLLLLTRAAVGPMLFHAFLANMHRVSGVLLVAENNQSFAAWWMGRFFSAEEVFDVNAFVLSSALRMVSLACMVISTGLGGLFDRQRVTRTQPQTPYGAGMVLIAMTIFAPIAWTHYYILLAIPLMMLAQAALELRPSAKLWLLWSAVAAIAALLFRPLAPDVVHMDLSDYAVLRGSFYAGCLSLVLLALLSFARSTSTTVVPKQHGP